MSHHNNINNDREYLVESYRRENENLYNFIEEHHKQINIIMEEIQHNRDLMYQICNHEWKWDLSDIEKTSYYCKKCHLSKNASDKL